MKFLSMIMLFCMLFYIISELSMKMSFDKEKLSLFECGFDSYMTPRTPFSIRFFKIILIFVLFDVEIILALPVPFNMFKYNSLILIIMLLLVIIYLGLIYEWKEGSLNWLN